MEVINHGICFGKIVVLDTKNIIKYQTKKSHSTIAEIKKLEMQLNFLIKKLYKLKKSFPNNMIIESYILFLKDYSFLDMVKARIQMNHENYIDSFNHVIDNLIKKFKKMNNVYFKERENDLQDIKIRFNQIFFDKILHKYSNKKIIIYTENIYPTTLIKYQKIITGVICDNSSKLSHASFICKSLKIPLIVDSNFNFDKEYLLLNTFNKNSYKFFDTLGAEAGLTNINDNHQEIVGIVQNTSDVEIYLNASNVKETLSLPSLFLGVGLFRTEFFYMENESLLDEQIEEKFYQDIIRNMNDKKIIVRLIDFGDDKKIDFLITNTKGFSNYIKFEFVIERQIKLLCQAINTHTNVSIIFPMVEKREEYEFLRKIVKKYQKIEIKTGILLETKKAFENLTDFKNIDFISVGTNDFIKEIYNYNRDSKNDKFDKTDFLDKMKQIYCFCLENKIDLSICGNVFFTKGLFQELKKIGFKKFSMNFQDLGSI